MSVADQLAAGTAALRRCKETKGMMKQINADIRAAANQIDSGLKGDTNNLFKEMEDAFSSTNKTDAEIKLLTRKAQNRPLQAKKAMHDLINQTKQEKEKDEQISMQNQSAAGFSSNLQFNDNASVGGFSEAQSNNASGVPLDPKQARREALKQQALQMVRKKGPKSSMSSSNIPKSDNSSVVSDMSYQSDLSEVTSNKGAFITAQPRKRPKSPPKVSAMPPLEEIKEEAPRKRCQSPTIRDWDPLAMHETEEKYSDRLSAYLEEAREALDYMEGLEEMIKDNIDINTIEKQKETVEKAVNEHIKMLETVGDDVIQRNLTMKDDILELELFVGRNYETNYELSKQGQAALREIKLYEGLDEDDEEDEPQMAIMASAPSLKYQETKKDEICDSLTSMFNQLKLFNETIEEQFKEDEKLEFIPALKGLSPEKKEEEKQNLLPARYKNIFTSNSDVVQSLDEQKKQKAAKAESKIEDKKYNRLAKQAEQWLSKESTNKTKLADAAAIMANAQPGKKVSQLTASNLKENKFTKQ